MAVRRIIIALTLDSEGAVAALEARPWFGLVDWEGGPELIPCEGDGYTHCVRCRSEESRVPAIRSDDLVPAVFDDSQLDLL